jgi:hypothetical protein
MVNKPLLNPVISWLTACRWPAVGASAPLPNSSGLKGRNAAACRVTLIDWARSHGDNAPAGPPAAFDRRGETGACWGFVVNVFSTIVAIALP